jgi:hypothetical protein
MNRLAAINCLRKPAAIRFQESRMSGNLLVRFDEGRVGRTCRCRPLSYSTVFARTAFLAAPRGCSRRAKPECRLRRTVSSFFPPSLLRVKRRSPLTSTLTPLSAASSFGFLILFAFFASLEYQVKPG